jgi:glycerol-3-phosphate dehydrogenase (NAD(P)+)
MKKVAIYGTGAFGYAILKHLDNKHDSSFQLSAYDHHPGTTEHLREKRSHPIFHKDTIISHRPEFFDTPEELVANADIIVLAVPSRATTEVTRLISENAPNNVTIVNIAKALDKATGKRLSEIVEQAAGDFPYHYAQLSGGTIASDLFHHEPLGIDIASEDESTRETLKQLFTSSNLTVMTTDDVRGVEYASALKNVISILAGIVKGLGFSYGSETHIISTTADYVGTICVEKLGAKPETFSIGSQCWGNDMWMSCTGNTRNRAFGELLGSGKPVSEALEEMHQGHKLVEGVNTLQVLDQLPEFKEVETIKCTARSHR